MKSEPFKKLLKTGEAWLSGRPGVSARGEGGAGSGNPPLAVEKILDPRGPTTIREFMTPDPVFVRLAAPLHEALDLLITQGFSALPVLDEDDLVVGLLNERHVLLALGDHDASDISHVMDHEPITVGVDEPIVEAIDRLMAINVRQVLVLEGTRLIGVVTRADLMPTILGVLRDRARARYAGASGVH